MVRAVPLLSKTKKKIRNLVSLMLPYFPLSLAESKLEHWAVTPAIHPQTQSVAFSELQ